MIITMQQLDVLVHLSRATKTSKEIGFLLNMTTDAARHSLRRLEDRELVRRLNTRPLEWELTAEGRKAIT